MDSGNINDDGPNGAGPSGSTTQGGRDDRNFEPPILEEPKDRHDAEGSPCTLTALCMREPMWAANRIQHMEKELKMLRACQEPEKCSCGWTLTLACPRCDGG